MADNGPQGQERWMGSGRAMGLFRDKATARVNPVHWLRRAGVICLRLLVVLGIVFGSVVVVWGFAAFYHFIFRSEYFLVRETVISNEPKDPQVSGEIRRKLRELAVEGQNLLFLKPSEIEKELQKIPKVKRARVVKDYPARVVVEIAERQMAGLLLHDPILAIDKEGVAIESLGPRDPRVLQRPLISGVRSTRISVGEQIQSEGLTRALLLLSCLEQRSSDLFKKTSEVHCDTENNITLFLQGGTEIRFGSENPLLKMPVLETVLSTQGPAERYVYIDLRFRNQVPCLPKTEAHLAAAAAAASP